VLDHSLLDVHATILHGTTNVFNDGLSLLIIENLSEQSSRLLVVVIRVLVRISASFTGDSPFVLSVTLVLNGSVQGVRLVVNTLGIFVTESHWETISMVGVDSSSVWAVNRKLLIVRSETVSVSIGVREETTLKHLIKRRFNTWDQVARSESRLLSLSMVVLGVTVENQFTNLLKRIITMRPDLGDVVNIESIFLGISEWHNLDIPSPR